MEQPNCTESEIETRNVKSEGVESGEPIKCNGFAEEDSKKVNLKRKASETEENEKKYVKLEDHGGGDIPAHHARRPPNGFLLFCKRHRDIVSAKNPNLENRGVTKLLGNWWRTLEEEERGKYKELARQNKEIFIANNPQFTWYKLPAPPLRTLVTRPSNRRPPKLETSPINPAGPITPGKLADESQLGGLTNLLSSSVSPPSTPFNASPPSPTQTAPAHPKKRFLLQTRAKQCDAASLSESDEASENNKSAFKTGKKTYKKKKNWNSLKYKRNLKMKWNDSFSGKIEPSGQQQHSGQQMTWKTDNGSPNCTHQQLIEKIVDSSFDSQKANNQNYDIQRKLDYINTEHTYQKNPGRFWHPQKGIKKESGKVEQNIISPNVNNNTILITETEPKKENGLSDVRYSYNDAKLISDYADSNQRDQASIQTNHDRLSDEGGGEDEEEDEEEDGYIPEKSARKVREDCDNKEIGLEDQKKKPLKVTQDDELEEDVEGEEADEEDAEEEEEEDEDEDEEDIPKNCDRDSNFQSILGKVSREIGNMINERSPDSTEEMAVAKFNLRSRSDSDSEESTCDDKSDTTSPPESPGGGRRSKRSCKGQRYEQFIKDSVSKKRTKNPELYNAIEYRKKRKNPSSDELDSCERKSINNNNNNNNSNLNNNNNCSNNNNNNINNSFINNNNNFNNYNDVNRTESEERERIVVQSIPGEKPALPKDGSESGHQISDDLNLNKGTKASEIIKMKLEKESKLKKDCDESKLGRKQKDSKIKMKKKPISKVQMIKEKRELHIGEFNLNEKIEELPLLSFESFLQKKRQRKKRLLGLKKDGMRSRGTKNKPDKYNRNRDSRTAPNIDSNLVPNKSTNPGQNVSKPDFADLTTLAETALTLLSLREPRNIINEDN